MARLSKDIRVVFVVLSIIACQINKLNENACCQVLYYFHIVKCKYFVTQEKFDKLISIQ